jgi:23S rRNA (cytidine2498-2'-O)-methyltransferase
MGCSLRLKKLPNHVCILIPFLHFEHELERELVLNGIDVLEQNRYYILVKNLDCNLIWARTVLKNCQVIPISGKSAALKILKNRPYLGCFLPSPHFIKLTASIRKELRELKMKRLKFEVPGRFNFKYFVWTINSNGELLVCDQPEAQYPLGWYEFEENKSAPPNRAYLKLWESLTLGHIRLSADDVVADLGASPGGWTWVLSDIVKHVYSVDKAPLNENITKRQNVTYFSEDAFTASPTKFKNCNWMFSDIICTPLRLLELVETWLNAGQVKNYHCTIKFKGSCDFDILRKFLNIENSKIIHLYQNKNEVTWIKQEKK